MDVSPPCMFPRLFNSSFSFQSFNNYLLQCHQAAKFVTSSIFLICNVSNNFVKQVDVHDFDFLPIEKKALQVLLFQLLQSCESKVQQV